jgi:hypothetical protein
VRAVRLRPAGVEVVLKAQAFQLLLLLSGQAVSRFSLLEDLHLVRGPDVQKLMEDRHDQIFWVLELRVWLGYQEVCRDPQSLMTEALRIVDVAARSARCLLEWP